jgi:lichenan operon transcriptional antiterminator
VYTTSQEVASELYISDRTARKYLHLVGDILEKNGAHLEAKQGQGYRLLVTDDQQFQQFYHQEVQDVSLVRDATTIHESEDRQYFILQRLFFEQNEARVDDLASELFVSRSTISNDIVEMKKMLKPYKLEVKSKAGVGIYIVGDEQNKRHFMMSYFFMNHLHDNLYTFSMYTDLLEGISIEEIVIIVLDECRESQLKLSDFIIYNIVLHIGLAIKRLQTGFQIEQSHLLISENSKEYQTALNIIQRIKQSMGIEFPKEEATYISMHLRNRLSTSKVLKKTDYSESEIKHQLIDTLAKLDKKTGFQFQQDATLINGLMMHFTPLLLRLQNDTSIKNPLLGEIKQKYSQLFDRTIQYFSEMPVFKKYQVTEEEWAYVTIHLTAAVERFFNNQKARVLVICATGLGSSQMLKIRLEHEFSSKIMITSVIGYYELSNQKLGDVDLIISSITLPMAGYNIPIVHVSVFLDEKDIQRINHELSKHKGLQRVNSQTMLLNGEAKKQQLTLLEQCFSKELFVYLPTKSEKESVITQLIARVEDVEGRPITEQLTKQLQLRETYSSVAFSQTLAVPHPIEPVTEQAYVAVAIAPEGIFWDAEHPSVKLVFLSLPDKARCVPIDKINQMFVPILEDETFSHSLIASQTFEEFMEIFMNYL